MIALLFRTARRTLSSSGGSVRIARYSMASSTANAAPVESVVVKRQAETPLRSEEESRGSYRFKNKRMRKGHGDSSQILRTNGSNEEVLLEDVNVILKSFSLENE